MFSSTLKITRYRLKPAGWPLGFRLRIGVLADLHACDPWMNRERIAQIVARANDLRPDVFVLLGDYVSDMRFIRARLPDAVIAGELARLGAPLGVHAVLGNHDWWVDPVAQQRGTAPVAIGSALMEMGISVYENGATRLQLRGKPFWIAGLGDQRAFYHQSGTGEAQYTGTDDLATTLGRVTDDAPVILLAHEPDIFPHVPGRVSLTLSGHTHGGQIKLFGRTPVVPSIYGDRYVYGHINEGGRDLIVSGGLGCSGIPIRYGVPPEINLIELGD